MIKKYFFSVVMMLMTIYGQSQVASGSFGSTYVPSDGFISIFGNHTFDFADCALFPGLILTDRTGNPGFVNFTDGATWTDASDASHVDGYVRTFSTNPFVFPVGNEGRLRLIGISGSENATVAYHAEDAALVTGVMTISNPDIEAVSTREYWTLSGDDETIVTMTWGQLSNVEDLVGGDINKLTIVGWNGTGWVAIPTLINDYMIQTNSLNIANEAITTSFVIGSMSSASAFDPNDFELFTLGSLAIPRSSAVDDSEMSVYPNPAQFGTPTYVSFNLKGQRGKMEIYDSYNRLVHSELLEQPSGNILLPTINRSDDRYVITIIEEDGSKNSKYLIVIK